MTGKDPPADQPVTRTEAEGATIDLPEGLGFFSTGQVLGERYEVLEMLGRGGMGEVWRAFDLKLRVEVGLKALREELFQNEGRREMLRQEVRAAREVVSPNVCRIFDLIEIDGRELVSMEYVDGATLLGVLQERGPLELKEAQDIASQFLAGLEAIHKAGLVHRDVKPENIMLTRAGRVVVMDFGLARGPESGAGSVSGTPAYMAPEHASGQQVDARADVYSAGVVLAEMVSPEGIKSYESRQSVWEGVRSEPAQVPDSPWAPVIQRAVARDRERRPNSAHTLIRELEDVTLRVEGAEDLHPYPGLASFTEADAEYFFGREAEVERMWRRIEGPPRMLVLVGPSGAGKTSFLQAGLLAHRGADWSCVVCKPGNNPQLALGRALAHEITGDVEAMELMLRFDDPDVATEIVSRWRHRTTNALLVVDQFEELFTQSGVEEQRRFSELLAQIVLTANVHVLLSMRDDFLMRCHDHEAFAPIFSDLTPLRAPTGTALRRALVQPATKCGYRFEDDDLVEEILAEVEGERGALPLLAFALARLWEKRDRETGLLTRQAYQDIGGVGGALARHAEATVDRIGVEQISVVRELFRNLVTAEGTRAVREWDELLSVFGGGEHRPSESLRTSGDLSTRKSDSLAQDDRRGAAAEVLRELINARLLTSYEVHEDEHDPIRRVEIIHESLLANWPRLVRWQTQDQEGAQLRDELRQAARTWEEHDRTDDLLWTGTAYREFRLWREHYPGNLTEVEEAFGEAMTSLATRRKRRRRIAATAAFVVLFIVLAVVGTLWRRSIVETRRAEAAGLLSLAQVELEPYPSASIAYATASLELSDSLETRQLVVEALWKGPTAFVVNEIPSWEIGFTPDGQWLVQSTDATPYSVHIIGADGCDDVLEDVHEGWVDLRMDRMSGLFATLPTSQYPSEPLALWSAPEKRLLTKGRSGYPENMIRAYDDLGRRRMLLIRSEDGEFFVDAHGFDGTSERLGALPLDLRWSTLCGIAPGGEWFAVAGDQGVYVIEVGDHDLSGPRRLEYIEDPVADIECDPLGQFVAARHEDGHIRLWDLLGESPPKVIEAPPDIDGMSITTDGSMIEAFSYRDDHAESWTWSLETETPTFLRHIDLGKASGSAGWNFNPVDRHLMSVFNPDAKIRLWPLLAVADSEPMVLGRGNAGVPRGVEAHPMGAWVASSFTNRLTLWPVSRPYPMVIRQYEERVANLLFAPDGEWLATSSLDSSGTVRKWQLNGDSLPPAQIIHEGQSFAYGLAVTPDGKRILLGKFRGVDLLSLDGEPPRALPDGGSGFVVGGVAISPYGRFGAATIQTATRQPDRSDIFGITVWDLDSAEIVTVLESGTGRNDWDRAFQFGENGRLLSAGPSGLRRWNLETGENEILSDESYYYGVANSESTRALLFQSEPDQGLMPFGRCVVHDLDSGRSTPLTVHGDRIANIAMNPAGTTVVTGDEDGVIRVGPITGEEPHLLLGHVGQIYALAVDPLGRWIASSGQDNTIRLWPMPDLSKPPLHTLPREELIAKLKTLTNLRVVRDPESSTGWKLTHDPFPGWETVPTW